MKKLILLTISLLCVVTMIGCSGHGEGNLTVTATNLEVEVGGTVEMNVRSSDTCCEIFVSLNNDNVTYDKTGSLVTFTGVKLGETVATFTQNSDTISVNITISESVDKYGVYKADGELVEVVTSSFYRAIDELYAVANENGALIKDEKTGEVLFKRSTALNYNFLNSNGLTNNILPTNIISDGSIYGDVGQTLYWSTYVEDTKLFTQSTTSLLYTQYVPTFIGRPSDFNLAYGDESGGYSKDPNETWNGWRASIYRAGLSVAQYAGWADLTTASGEMDQFIFTYDLSSGEMKPSENENQPTRADIWLGSSNSSSCDDLLMGVTFDAGTTDSTKDLEDGATREWFLFYEQLDSINSSIQKDRTLSTESVGTATWNKEKGVWIHDFSITINQTFEQDVDGNLVRKMVASVGEDTIEIEYNDEEACDLQHYRFTYGINYTPDYKTNNRFVADLANGGYWTNVNQTSARGYSNGVIVRNYNFLIGRLTNEVNQVGLYGSDVVSVRNANGNSRFNFIY